MKVLVTGGTGMLGQAVTEVMSARGHDVTAASRAAVDVTSIEHCRDVIEGQDVVINAAAWTRVDDAETHEAQAFAVNATGAANVARVCRESGAHLVHISTDYVFAGEATDPYAEDAPLAPRSAYGRTKAAGEWAVRAECPESLVVRTAWLYGPGGPNFVRTMARLAGEHETLSVVDDQRGQPTSTGDLAGLVADLLEAHAPAGTYHGTSEGSTTWFGLTRAIFEELGLDPARVLPSTAAAFPRPAPRPAYSVLGHERTRSVGLPLLPHWREALAASIHVTLKGIL